MLSDITSVVLSDATGWTSHHCNMTILISGASYWSVGAPASLGVAPLFHPPTWWSVFAELLQLHHVMQDVSMLQCDLVYSRVVTQVAPHRSVIIIVSVVVFFSAHAVSSALTWFDWRFDVYQWSERLPASCVGL